MNAVIVILLCILIFLVFRETQAGVTQGQPAIEYTDLVVVLLTCVTVIFTIGAVVVGIVAVWGYKAMIEQVSENASMKLSQQVEKEFKEEGQAYLQIKEEFFKEGSGLREWIATEVEKSVADSSYRFDMTQHEHGTQDEGDVS